MTKEQCILYDLGMSQRDDIPGEIQRQWKKKLYNEYYLANKDELTWFAVIYRFLSKVIDRDIYALRYFLAKSPKDIYDYFDYQNKEYIFSKVHIYAIYISSDLDLTQSNLKFRKQKAADYSVPLLSNIELHKIVYDLDEKARYNSECNRFLEHNDYIKYKDIGVQGKGFIHKLQSNRQNEFLYD